MANRYTDDASAANDATTQGAGARPAVKAGGVRKWRDQYTLATADWANSDVLHLGPFRAGEIVDGNTFRITGDATVDLGDDVDIGWAYVDGTGTADPDAFVAGTTDCSAATIDVLGLVPHDGTVDSGFWEPPTNDRPWWLTITVIDATGEAAGEVYFTADIVNFR